MRIWIISSSYPRYPTESINAGVLARDVALTYAALGHQVTVLTPDKPGGITFDAQLSGQRIRWWRPSVTIADLSVGPVDLIRSATLLCNGMRLAAKLALRDPPDRIVSLWGIPSGLFGLAAHRATGAPYSVWLLGSDVWNVKALPFGRQILQGVLRHAALRFADGRSLAQQAQQVTGVPVQVLHSVRRLPVSPSDERHGVLFIGRYHPNKGPDLLVEAFMMPPLRECQIRLTMCGIGPMEESLRRMAGEPSVAGRIDLLGPASALEASHLMARHRVLVIPSRQDSVPLVLGDAVQARIPVVVTDVGDAADFVSRHRIGLVANGLNPVDLGDAVRTLYERGAPSAAWDSAKEELSLDRAATSLISLTTPD